MSTQAPARDLLALKTLPPEEMDAIRLDRGPHETRGQRLCAIEAAAWLAGEPHSDSPPSVCPAIREFVSNWNDLLGDQDRERLLKPLLIHLPGTNAGPHAQAQRHAATLDWLLRKNIPGWLEMAGFDRHAARLARFRPISHRSLPGQLQKAGEILARVQQDIERARRQIPGSRAFGPMAERAAHRSANTAVERWGPDGAGRVRGNGMLAAGDRIAAEAAAVIAAMAAVQAQGQGPEEEARAGAHALAQATRRAERSAQSMALHLAQDEQQPINTQRAMPL